VGGIEFIFSLEGTGGGASGPTASAEVLTDNFMVAGANGMGYSYDGYTWYEAEAGEVFANGTCNTIVWNGNIWLAGGSGDTDRIAWSSDGVSWKLASEHNNTDGFGNGNDIFTVSCNTVAWNGSLWVAGGVGTYHLAYSSDGINWTASTLEIFSGRVDPLAGCTSVAWNGSLWVATVNLEETTDGSIIYSYDGITWNSVSVTSIFSTGLCNTVAWNGSLWVAGGSGVSVGSSTLTSILAYSSDGIIWTESPSSVGLVSMSYNTVAWNGFIWVAGGKGDDDSSCMAYSYDGTDWTLSSNGYDLQYGCSSLAWNGSVWIAGATLNSPPSNNRIISSSDGKIWGPLAAGSAESVFTSRCTAVASRRVLPYLGLTIVPQPRAVTENFMVAGGSGDNKLTYTYDGFTWLVSNSGNAIFSSGSAVCNAVAWNGSLWVAVGSAVAYSSNGIDWIKSVSGTEQFAGGGPGMFAGDTPAEAYSVAWTGSEWIAGGTEIILSSPDAIEWTDITPGGAARCYSMAWNGNFLLIARDGVESYYSEGRTLTLTSWPDVTGQSYQVFSSTRAVAWNGTKWIAGGEVDDGTYSGFNMLYSSTDGLQWTPILSGYNPTSDYFINGDIGDIAWNGSMWLVCSPDGNGNSMAFSYDGVQWTPCINGSTILFGNPTEGYSFTSLSWNGSIWTALTDYGRMYTSTNGVNWISSTNTILESSTQNLSSQRICSRRLLPYGRSTNTQGDFFIRTWRYDGTTGGEKLPDNETTIQVYADGTGILVTNNDINGSAIKWLNSLNGVVANTSYPVLLSFVKDESVAETTTAFIVTGVTINSQYTVIEGSGINIDATFALGDNLNVIFSIEPSAGGASGPTPYTPAQPGNWSNPAPSNVAEALDRLAEWCSAAAGGLSLGNP
jgi:hypothetical protein